MLSTAGKDSRRTRTPPLSSQPPATSLNLSAPDASSALRRRGPLSREPKSLAEAPGDLARRVRLRHSVCRRPRTRGVLSSAAGTMFLTALLCRGRIPGRQWIGKHRRPRFVSLRAKQNMIRRLEIEAENHYWLSMPYMTREQERGHAAVRRREAFEAIKVAATSKFPPHRFIADQLDHLNVTKKWS
uniref:Mitochondrial ribosomal protein L57 n=2 Tax=Pongo abelii TaxID=9601 RepID=H2NJD3_PONAB